MASPSSGPLSELCTRCAEHVRLDLRRAATIDQIKAKIAGWKQEIYRDIQAYKQFHMFVFDYLRQDKKILRTLFTILNALAKHGAVILTISSVLDEAILVWDMIFKPRGWGLYAQWIQFLKVILVPRFSFAIFPP
jgi:hypothetical protein